MEPPIKKTKASHDGRYHPLNLFRNWLHQALSYMDRGELAFRIVVEVAEVIIIYYGLVVLNPGTPAYLQIIFAVLIAHTVNWFINSNFWALYLFAFPFAENQGEQETVKYLSSMSDRLRKRKCVGGVALFGSAARGAWHTKSDLDIRVIRRKGPVNLLLANIVIMRERLIAFIKRQPADLFLADSIIFLRKMRADERPIFLVKGMSSLDDEYPDNNEIRITRLVDHNA